MPDDATTKRNELIQRFVRDRGHFLGFLRVLCRDGELAEELFQELSLAVIEGIDNFDSSRDFGAWATVTMDSVSTGEPYALGTAQAGALFYIDRSYTIGSLSSALAGGVLIRTANDDKHVTTASHRALTLSAPATVYVCYDERATALPAWLNDGSWTLTSLTFAPTLTRITTSRAARSSPCSDD